MCTARNVRTHATVGIHGSRLPTGPTDGKGGTWGRMCGQYATICAARSSRSTSLANASRRLLARRLVGDGYLPMDRHEHVADRRSPPVRCAPRSCESGSQWDGSRLAQGRNVRGRTRRIDLLARTRLLRSAKTPRVVRGIDRSGFPGLARSGPPLVVPKRSVPRNPFSSRVDAPAAARTRKAVRSR
jgi:hypothetical protein